MADPYLGTNDTYNKDIHSILIDQTEMVPINNDNKSTINIVTSKDYFDEDVEK
jgi:hypothetical protein